MAKPKKYVSKSRKAAIALFIFTVLTLVMGIAANSTPETYSDNNMAPGMTFSVITLIVFVFSLFAPKTKEEELKRKEYRTVPSGKDKIIGTVLCIIGGFFSIGLIMPILMITDINPIDPMGMCIIVCGVLMGLFGIFVLVIAKRYLFGQYVDPELIIKKYGGPIIDEDVYGGEQTDTACDITNNKIVSFDIMGGHEFEHFCAELLKENGFSNVRVTKGSGDQGVDILASKEGVKYAIQCKKYDSALGNTPIQEVSAGKLFYKCHVGVVMTNSTFTKGAKELAEATGTLLWDGSIIQRMLHK